MSKAVLVMDMPKDCSVCPMHEFTFDGDCVFAFYDEDENYHLNCPLKEMPSSKDAIREEPHSVEDYRIGWNACLKEIIGDEE